MDGDEKTLPQYDNTKAITSDEENWDATHRFGGKVWFIGAIVILASSLLPTKISVCVMIAATLAMALTPIIYSYRFYKKKKGK